MKKFITLLTIAMVAILATSCGTAGKVSKAQKTDTVAFSETSQHNANVLSIVQGCVEAVAKDHADVSTTVQTRTTQRTSGNSVHEETKTVITSTFNSNGRVEGASFDLKPLKGRELEGHKYGTSVNMQGGEVYDENYNNSDNH